MTASRIAGIGAAIAVALGALLFLYHRASAAPQPMQAEELSRIVRQLASDARESQRLAMLAAAGQLNGRYARAQHEKLAEDLSNATQKLDAPPPRGGEQAARRVAELARQMKDLLSNAPSRMADRAALERMAGDHGRIADELGRLASP